MQYQNASELFQWIETTERSYKDEREMVARLAAQATAYYEGVQWAAAKLNYRETNNGRLYTDWNVDSPTLRVVDNIVTSLAVKTAAQGFMSSADVEVLPGDRDSSATAQAVAQAQEDAISVALDMAGYLNARRAANHGRVIMGDFGVGLSLAVGPRGVWTGDAMANLNDWRLRCFSFDPTKLVLDPSNTSPNLCDHDEVIFRDVWTLAKARDTFGTLLDGIEEKQCKKFGELTNFEQTMNAITDGRLFSRFVHNSEVPAVVVRQIHCKDDRGRFGHMSIVVDGGYQEGKRWVNEDSPYSPFGGNGLPLMMLHGHRRIGSPFSISDVMMVMQDQNRRNILKTIFMRHARDYSQWKYIADERFFGRDIPGMMNQLNNRVGGVIHGKSSRLEGIERPEILTLPAPSESVSNAADREWDSASAKVSRPDITSGMTKSNVPDSTFQTALEQADQIGNVRVMEDVETDQVFMVMVLGTMTRAVHENSPSALVALRRRGFGPEDFALLSTQDPDDEGVRVKVRTSSVRNRSHTARLRSLDNALTTGAITEEEYRLAAASDLDIPLTEDDRLAARESQKAAIEVIMGFEWEPIPMGSKGDFFVSAFRRALMDRRVKADPETKARLVRAIEGQIEMRTQETLASDPAYAAQMEQAQMQAQAAPAAPTAPVPGANQTSSVSQVMAALSGAG